MCNHDVDWAAAADAAEQLLGLLRVPLAKALDPLDPDDFVKISAQLSRELDGAREKLTVGDVRSAIDSLDVDWTALPPAGQVAVVEAANQAIRLAEERALPAISQIIEVEFDAVVGSAKQSASAAFDLDIELSTDLVDQRVARTASRQDVYFRNDAGRRVESFSKRGRSIISSGMEQGLRSADITADLQAAARATHLVRPQHYMRVVATQAMNSARVYGLLRSFDEAAIDAFVFEAVLDERTTEVCRMLDGTVFRVGPALGRYQDIAAESDPEAVLDLKPWVRERRDPATRLTELFVRDRLGIETRIATVEEPAKGRAGEVGVYSNRLDLPTMEQLGLSYPPLHGLCRSTILPDL